MKKVRKLLRNIFHGLKNEEESENKVSMLKVLALQFTKITLCSLFCLSRLVLYQNFYLGYEETGLFI